MATYMMKIVIRIIYSTLKNQAINILDIRHRREMVIIYAMMVLSLSM